MFLSELVVRKISGKRFSYKVEDSLIYEDGRYHITVPEGFVCDFASVPWLFQRLMPKMGTLSDRPAVLHDYIYATELFNRKTCDKLFLESMLLCGVPVIKAYSMYWAVRIGGGSVWKEHTYESVNEARILGGYPTLE